MPRARVALGAVAVVLTLLVTAAVVRVYLQVCPASATQKILESTELATGAKLSFEHIRLAYFPEPSAVLKDVTLLNIRDPGVTVKAKRAELSFDLLSLLFGQIRMNRVKLEGAEAVWPLGAGWGLRRIRLTDAELKMEGFGSGRAVWLDFRGHLGGGGARNTEGRAQFDGTSFRGMDSPARLVSLDLKWAGLSAADFQGDWDPNVPFEWQGGTLSGRCQVGRVPGKETLEVRTDLVVSDFVYRMRNNGNSLTSPASSGTFLSEWEWNMRSGEMALRSSTLELPVGKVEVAGRWMNDTGEIRDMRLRVATPALEKLPLYWFSVQDVIPFNIGFSGQSNLEMSLSGTWDHLGLAGNWDLSGALLSYGTVFSKPKDVPLNFSFDYLLKKGRALSGEFSLKFEKAKAKGSVRSLDFQDGKGQVNILTNKFPLAGWETMAPPLRDYELGGDAKFLINLSGNFKKMDTIQPMVNITLDNVKAVHKQTATGIQNVFAVADYGQVALKVKQLRMEINGSPIEAVVTAYNLKGAPVVKGRVVSPYFLPAELFSAYRDFREGWLKTPLSGTFRGIESALGTLFGPEEPVKNLIAEFSGKAGKWYLPKLEFEAYDGWVISSGGWSPDPAAGGRGWMNWEINHLALARFLGRVAKEKKWAAGNLFAKVRMNTSGAGAADCSKNLSLEGELAVTNGEFNTFDLLGAVGKIDELKAVNATLPGKTLFHDLQAAFRYQEGKTRTEVLTMVSEDLSFKGGGEVLAGGILNYRGGVYLSAHLTQQVLASLFPGYVSTQDGRQLGPIPMLVAGAFVNPEIKPDPAELPQFRDQLLRDGSREVLGSFLPEELFFDRRTKS
ncbi:MAG: AsmA family protein [Candidatus Omnitrophota bacterium]|jgi:hypothetical protein